MTGEPGPRTRLARLLECQRLSFGAMEWSRLCFPRRRLAFRNRYSDNLDRTSPGVRV